MGARSTTFTSYVNIEPAKGIDASMSALERKTNATLTRIAQQAQKAGSITNGVRPGQNSAQISQMATAERQRATAIQQTVTATNAAAAASGRLTAKHMLESNAARAAAASTSTLERSLRLASVAANVAQGPLGPLAGRLSAVATAVRELTGIRLGLVGAGALGTTFVRAAAGAQELKSKLYPLFDSQDKVNSAFADTIRIANSARLSLEPVVDLYSRLTLGGRDVGLSQQRIAALTETAAKAAKLSGGTQQSQDAGLYQFAQGIGSGNLAGDELKSVRENTLRLAKAIADGMGVSIAELKKLGADGKLTAEVIATALEKQRSKIEAELDKLPPTIASATAKLQTAWLQMVSGADEAYGVTATLAGGLNILANNLGLVTRAVVGLAVAYASIRAANMAKSIAESTVAWNSQRAALNEAREAQVRNAQQAMQAAAEARAASAQKVIALREERIALQANIAAEAEAAAMARQNRNDLTAKTTGKNYPGRALDILALKKASDEAVIAEQRLGVVQDRNRQVALQLHQATQGLTSENFAYRNAVTLSNAASGKFVANAQNMRSALGSLRAETGSLIVAKQRLRAAMDANSRSANIFAAAGRSLWGVIGPNLLGLALGVGINLLMQWAMSQDQAAAAADRMAARENALAGIIDFSTGKIREQNAVLVENARLKAQQGLVEAATDFRSAQTRLAPAGSQYDPNNIINKNRRAAGLPELLPGSQVLYDLQQKKINIAQARSLLMAQKAPKSAFDKLDAFESSANGLLRQQAGVNILSGKASKSDYDRLGISPMDTKPAAGAGGGAADKKLAGARKERASGTDAAAKAERELQRIQDRTDKRTDILSRYEEQSSAMRRAEKDARELQQLVGKEILDPRFISSSNAIGKGIYTEEMAAADKSRIEFGVRQPMRDLIDEQRRGLEVSRLRLEGYNLEADALEKALSIQDNIGVVERAELETLIAQERQQARVNDALESRQRQVQGILDAANQTRDAFENMLVGLRKNPIDAVKNFGNTIIDNITRIEARRLTEKLFAGADEKLRDLISGSNGVDRAAEILASNVRSTADSLPPLGNAASNTASALENATQRINAAADGLSGGVSGLAPLSTAIGGGQSLRLEDAFDMVFGQGRASSITSIVTKVAGAASGVTSIAAIPAVLSAARVTAPANDNGGAENQPIIVNAPRKQPAPEKPGQLPSGSMTYTKVFEVLGESLDKTFKSGGFFKGLGGAIGGALGGAGTGMMASGVLSVLGIKQSSTGAAIGGALGSFLGPAGSIVGGLLGGTIGGLLAKRPRGSGSVVNGTVSASANDADIKSGLMSMGGNLADRINQIAQALGAEVGNYSVGFGNYKGKYYQVSGNATDRGLGESYYRNKGSAVLYDGEDPEAAMAAALKNALEDGAIKGISEAAQRILKAGKDLNTALNKAVAIENIPKRLLAKTDPVRFAVQQLNDEFTKLISYLKEGGATAAQFADAQKLYELERADAIKQATQQSMAAIQAYMDEMKGGASSPFNKQTVYENAAAKLASFRGDIQAGKVVDQNELLAAAKNFQDASQRLYGSSEQFFADFDNLFQLLTKARDNAGGTGTANLPDSPFSSADMTTYLSQLNQTTSTQTDVLAGRLDAILDAIRDSSFSDRGYLAANDAMTLLPGYMNKLEGYG